MTEGTNSYSDLEPKICDAFHMAQIVATMVQDIQADPLAEKIDGYERLMVTAEEYETLCFAVYHLSSMLRNLKAEFYAAGRKPC